MAGSLRRRVQGAPRVRLLGRSAAGGRAGPVLLSRAVVADEGRRPGRVPEQNASPVVKVGDGLLAGRGISLDCPADRELVMMRRVNRPTSRSHRSLRRTLLAA